MNFQKILPPTWLLIALGIALALHVLVPVAWIIPPGWNPIGLLFLVAGVTLNLSGDRAFKQAHTTIKPFEDSSTLVTEGVFRLSRNPMYLGMVLVLTGVALLLRSLSPFLVILPFAILIDQVFVRVEERMLAERFGALWIAYTEKSRRWL